MRCVLPVAVKLNPDAHSESPPRKGTLCAMSESLQVAIHIHALSAFQPWALFLLIPSLQVMWRLLLVRPCSFCLILACTCITGCMTAPVRYGAIAPAACPLVSSEGRDSGKSGVAWQDCKILVSPEAGTVTHASVLPAMQESGGTVLSTNWKDVGKKKVTCSPPSGMEKRDWEQ